MRDFVREEYGDVFKYLEIKAVRQVQKSIEMCLWAAKQQNFRVRDYESGTQKKLWCVLCNGVGSVYEIV